MKKIVLTGGPCAGKTTVMRAIAKQFEGQIGFVPEVATMLLSSGWPLPGRDVEWTPEWRDAFQRAIAITQQELERAYELTAHQQGWVLLVTDRGLMDGAAYHDSNEDFAAATGVEPMTALGRYEAVIHLESLAVSLPEAYSSQNNAHRYESQEEAARLDAATRQAWSGHTRHLIIDGVDLQRKTRTAIEIIEQSLG